MILIFNLVAIALIVAAAVFLGPRLSESYGNTLAQKKRLRAERYIERHGTPTQQQRLAELREREVELRLKLLEAAQAHKILEAPAVHEALVAADINIELLKRALESACDAEHHENLLDETMPPEERS